MKTVLIDSDVCLDFITGREPHFADAKRLFWTVENKKVHGIVSPDSFSNMFYILRKFYTPAKAIEQLIALRALVQTGMLKETTVDQALHSGWTDFEDALQHFAALENTCDVLITRNISDYKDARLPIHTPGSFLETEGITLE